MIGEAVTDVETLQNRIVDQAVWLPSLPHSTEKVASEDCLHVGPGIAARDLRRCDNNHAFRRDHGDRGVLAEFGREGRPHLPKVRLKFGGVEHVV
jgi:hypothetical protein